MIASHNIYTLLNSYSCYIINCIALSEYNNNITECKFEEICICVEIKTE